MDFLWDLFIISIILALFVLPSFYWVRWPIRAFKKKRKIGVITSVISYLIFLSGWVGLIFGATQFIKNRIGRTRFEIHAYFVTCLISSLLIVLVYFYFRGIYKAFKEKKMKSVYFRLSLLLFSFVFVVYNSFSYIIHRRNDIGKDLGISISYWGTNFNSYDYGISGLRGEGKVKAEIKLDKVSFDEIEEQIKQTKYFAYQKEELFGADMVKWPKSDTVHYWNIRKHLEKTKLTGLWTYDKEKRVYEFYEPRLSDIANAAILFNQNYMITATLNNKTRVLAYTRFQY